MNKEIWKEFWKEFWKHNWAILIAAVFLIPEMLSYMLNPSIEMIPIIRETMLWPLGLTFILGYIFFIPYRFFSLKKKFLKEKKERRFDIFIDDSGISPENEDGDNRVVHRFIAGGFLDDTNE